MRGEKQFHKVLLWLPHELCDTHPPPPETHTHTHHTSLTHTHITHTSHTYTHITHTLHTHHTYITHIIHTHHTYIAHISRTHHTHITHITHTSHIHHTHIIHTHHTHHTHTQFLWICLHPSALHFRPGVTTNLLSVLSTWLLLLSITVLSHLLWTFDVKDCLSCWDKEHDQKHLGRTEFISAYDSGNTPSLREKVEVGIQGRNWSTGQRETVHTGPGIHACSMLFYTTRTSIYPEVALPSMG